MEEELLMVSIGVFPYHNPGSGVLAIFFIAICLTYDLGRIIYCIFSRVLLLFLHDMESLM